MNRIPRFLHSTLKTRVTVFDKILGGQIPSKKVYEDDEVYAFQDISPQAPIHILVIPKHKQQLTGISKAEEKHKLILGTLLVKTAQIARGIPQLQEGYRLVINEGAHGQQSVSHLHIHLIGGKQLSWPPG